MVALCKLTISQILVGYNSTLVRDAAISVMFSQDSHDLWPSITTMGLNNPDIMGISIPMNMDGFPSPTNLTTALIGHHRTNHLKLLVIKNEAIKFMAPHYLSSLMARSRSLAILQIYSSYIYICIIHTYIYIYIIQ